MFKVGDRVIATIGRFKNKQGTVLIADSFGVLVEFDMFIAGHSGLGIGKRGHCYWLDHDALEKIPNRWLDRFIRWFSK